MSSNEAHNQLSFSRITYCTWCVYKTANNKSSIVPFKEIGDQHVGITNITIYEWNLHCTHNLSFCIRKMILFHLFSPFFFSFFSSSLLPYNPILYPPLGLQYRIGQLYMISKHSCEQSGGGEGVEVVRNESDIHPQHGPGQLTEKRIYLSR